MKTWTITTLLLLTIAISSCNNCGRGSRALDSKTFSISNFTEVKAGGAFNVHLEPGDEYSVRATTQERILDNIKMDKDGNSLHIKLDRWHCNCNVPIDVYITMPELQHVDGSGGSEFELSNFDGSKLSVNSSGGSRVKGNNLSYSNFDLSSSGGSSVEFSGDASQIDIDMSGGSKVLLYHLPASNITVDGSGGSRAEINANNSIHADLSGGSRVEYQGNASVSAHTSGGASIVKQ